MSQASSGQQKVWCRYEKHQEPHPVQVAVQAVVQNGMEVLKAATVEGIDEVPLTLGLGKLGIHLITIHDLK